MAVTLDDLLRFAAGPPPGDPSLTAAGDQIGVSVLSSSRIVQLAKQSGADPMGGNDSTAVIASALAAVDALGGGALLVDGTFKFSTVNYTFTNPLALWFTPGSKWISTQAIQPGDGAKCVQLYGPAGGSLILDGVTLDFATPVNVDTNAGTRNANCEQLVVGGTDSSHMIKLRIRNGLELYNARNTAFYPKFCSRVDFDLVHVEHALAAGVVFADSTNLAGLSVSTLDTGDDGCQIVADAGLSSGALHFQIALVRGEKNYGACLDLTGAVYGTIPSVVGDSSYYPTLLVQQLTNLGLDNSTDILIGQVMSANAGQYYGLGQYKTSISSLPNGIAIQGNVQRVYVGDRVIRNSAGPPINISPNANGYPQATIESIAAQRRRPVSGEFIAPEFSNSFATVVLAANAATWTKIQIDEATTIQTINVNVTGAATGGTATLHVGIAADNGNLQPGGPVLWEGNTSADATTTGVKTASPALAVPAGTYWIGAVRQGTATTGPTVVCCSGQQVGFTSGGSGGNALNGWTTSGVSGNFPNPVTTNGTTSQAIYTVLGF